MKRTLQLSLMALVVVAVLSPALSGFEDRMLIAAPDVDDQMLQDLIGDGFPVVTHCNDVALVLGEESTWKSLLKLCPDAVVTTPWHAERRYFLIQTVVADAEQFCEEGVFLYRRHDLAVFEGPLHEAFNLRAGHAVILPITDEVITPLEPRPIDIELDSADDTLVQTMVDMVNQSAIETYVTKLSSLDRMTWTQDCDNAGRGIKDAFESWGYTDIHVQFYTSGWSPNIIAIKPGSLYPKEYVLIGAHYDSLSILWPWSAPGADDNASGTATVLEAARVMAGFNFERSLLFATFSGEELGLFGSNAVASYASSHGMDIRAVLNVDMDGYVDPGAVGDLDVIANTASSWIYDVVHLAAETYVPGLATVPQSGFSSGGSDHQSFWRKGYEAVWLFEDVTNYSPHIHTSRDTVGNSFNNPAFAADCTRTAVAALAILAGPIN